jgi:hypothetical protein
VGGIGVGVNVGVGVPGVAVGIWLGVGVSVGVGEGVKVAVAVGVRVGVKDGVTVGVGVRKISPRRFGILQAIRRIPSQARKINPGLWRLLRRKLHVFTIPYYTVKALQTNTIAIRSARQAALPVHRLVSRPTPRISVYLDR